MTDISKTTAPWWEAALPPYAPAVTRDSFYDDVANLRREKYAARPTAGLLKDKDFLVKFCLLVDAMGLDKHAAGKFCRLFKLVTSYDQFKSKVPEEARGLADDLSFVLDNFERPDLFERVRQALLPTREVTMTPAQHQGYNVLQILERERQSVLADYERQERQLQEQLRRLRQERDEFGRQLAVVIPQWGNVKRARDTTVSRIEREALVSRYEASKDLRARYTLEGYLATARANKVQEAERSCYDSFRRLGAETAIRARVAEARVKSTPSATAAVATVTEGAGDPLDFAPE